MERYISGGVFRVLCLEPIEPPLLFFPSSVLSIGSNSKCSLYILVVHVFYFSSI